MFKVTKKGKKGYAPTVTFFWDGEVNHGEFLSRKLTNTSSELGAGVMSMSGGEYEFTRYSQGQTAKVYLKFEPLNFDKSAKEIKNQIMTRAQQVNDLFDETYPEIDETSECELLSECENEFSQIILENFGLEAQPLTQWFPVSGEYNHFLNGRYHSSDEDEQKCIDAVDRSNHGGNTVFKLEVNGEYKFMMFSSAVLIFSNSQWIDVKPQEHMAFYSQLLANKGEYAIFHIEKDSLLHHITV